MFLSAGELIGGSVHSNRRLVFAERGKSTCDSKVGSQTQNTLVGGEHSHHSAISAPITLLVIIFFRTFPSSTTFHARLERERIIFKTNH